MSKRLLFAVASFLTAASAHAINIGDPFPSTGALATFKAVGLVISNLPLPSLDGGRVVITPQAGIMKVDSNNDEAAQSDQLNPNYKMRYFGSAKGNNVGLSFALHASPDLSFFVQAGGARLSGDFTEQINDADDQKLTNFQGQAIAGAVGMQYRLIGSDTSIFALGVFAGPMYYTSQGNGDFIEVRRSPDPSHMTFTPSGFGPLFGLQLMVRIGGFRINPYAKVMGDLTDMCKPIVLEGGPVHASDYTCNDRQGYIPLSAFAAGYGLMVGYKSFLFTVLSGSDNSSNLTPSSTSLSFAIAL